MPLSMLFWGIYILSLVFGWWGYYTPAQPGWGQRFGGWIVVWILIGMLGWHIFGPAVR